MITYKVKWLFWVEVAPYWNVNYIGMIFYVADIDVEVAPYWNVNGELELF